MNKLNPSMRLKVNRDTFFLPDRSKGIYLRNNLTSLRLEGGTIAQWIEKLIPAFDGLNSLDHLTNGLPESYLNRVYEIAQILYDNGFVHDVSKELPHQLSENLLEKYSSQIEFLDSIGGSGGYRFQTFRQAKVIVFGSGSLLLSMILSLIKTGVAKFSIMITDPAMTDQSRINELISEARSIDQDTEVSVIPLSRLDKTSLKEAIKPFDSVLFGLQDTNIDLLRLIESVCREERKDFMPITFIKEIAFAGPLIQPDSEVTWDSAFRRLHPRSLNENTGSHTFSPTAGSLLANLAVFELFKKITGVRQQQKDDRLYLLNLETLEGDWHTFFPHPLVSGKITAELIQDHQSFLEQRTKDQANLPALFDELTSQVSGIFHMWEEADLSQLPLSQCKVQTIDPLSSGPGQLKDKIVCAGMSHHEARREAGLVGIETYARCYSEQLPFKNPSDLIGIGTGETAVEGLFRAMQNWLDKEFVNQANAIGFTNQKLELEQIEDNRCSYYLEALNTLRGDAEFYSGSGVYGFPVIWVRSGSHLFGSAGLNRTLAMRAALQLAIMHTQNNQYLRSSYGVVMPAGDLRAHSSKRITLPAFHEDAKKQTLLAALEKLKSNKKQVDIFKVSLESVFNERLPGIFWLTAGEEELQ